MTMRLRAILPDVATVMTEAMAAQQRADKAESDAAAAKSTAGQAVATSSAVAGNLTTLEGLATSYQAALAASLEDRAQLRAMVTALQQRGIQVQSKRTQVTAQVLVNGTGTVTFTWDTPLADTAYTPILVALAPVADVTPTSVTRTGVTFSYKAGALIAVGTTMQALAIRYG